MTRFEVKVLIPKAIISESQGIEIHENYRDILILLKEALGEKDGASTDHKIEMNKETKKCMEEKKKNLHKISGYQITSGYSGVQRKK